RRGGRGNPPSPPAVPCRWSIVQRQSLRWDPTSRGAEGQVTIPPVQLPPTRELALRALPRLVEGVLVPTALFVGLLNIFGVGAAILGGFLWSVSVIVVRRALGRRVPTIVLAGLGFLFVRTVLSLATGSSFLYFL